MTAKDKLQEALLRSVLAWRGRRSAVRRAFKKAGPGGPTAPEKSRGGLVRVAAVQVSARLYRSGREFAGDMRRLAHRAASAGAGLAVFPEDVGSLLLGLIPGIERMAARGGDGRMPQGVSVTQVFCLLAQAALPVYCETFSAIARETGMYVFAGSLIVPDSDGRVYNRAFVFDPHGGLMGTQNKVHLFPSPVEEGLQPGEGFTLFELPFARAACPICMDATYFETFRLLAAKGVDLVAVPIANPEDYDFWYALRGIWPRIQENRMFGIKSAMVGNMLGFRLTGVSGVYAPLELTPAGDGVLAESDTHDGEDVVVADLDFDALHALARENPLDWRPEVYRRYLPGLYHRAGGMRSAAPRE